MKTGRSRSWFESRIAPMRISHWSGLAWRRLSPAHIRDRATSWDWGSCERAAEPIRHGLDGEVRWHHGDASRMESGCSDLRIPLQAKRLTPDDAGQGLRKPPRGAALLLRNFYATHSLCCA